MPTNVRDLRFASLSMTAALLVSAANSSGCGACQPTPIPPEATVGGTEDPLDETTTSGSQDTQTPTTSATSTTSTTSASPCPGYDDVCIFDSPDETRTLFSCEGNVDVKIDGAPTVPIPEEQNPFPYDIHIGFLGGGNDVIACCSGDYQDGCGEQPAPHLKYCHLDCAQQSCLRLVYDMEETIASWETNPDDAPNAIVQGQYTNIHNYLASNIEECQAALIARTDCDAMAAEVGEDPQEYCNSEFVLRGRYTLPDSEAWWAVENVHGDIRCEINDWAPVEPETSCAGILGNNNDPFGEGGPVPFQPMQAAIAGGQVIPEGPPPYDNLLDPVPLSGDRLEFRTVQCNGACPFKLDRLELRVDPVTKAGFTVHNVQAELIRVANGLRTGDSVSFGPGEIGLRVTGGVTAKNKMLDGFPIDILVLNKGTAVFKFDDSTIRIESAVFFHDDFRFIVSTPPCACSSL